MAKYQNIPPRRYYYLAKNKYGSPTSVGFANTWSVWVFESKKTRDAYLAEHGDADMSLRAIRKREIKDYHEAAAPFSGLTRAILFPVLWPRNVPDGYVGVIMNATRDSLGHLELSCFPL